MHMGAVFVIGIAYVKMLNLCSQMQIINIFYRQTKLFFL